MEIFEVGDCQLWVITALVDGGKNFKAQRPERKKGQYNPSTIYPNLPTRFILLISCSILGENKGQYVNLLRFDHKLVNGH